MDKSVKLDKNLAKNLVSKYLKESRIFIEKHIQKNNDPLTLTLKIHLYCEQLMNDILNFVLIENSVAKEFKFEQKVKTLKGLGIFIVGDLSTKLLKLNSIRNKMSHNIEFKINENNPEVIILMLKNIDKNLSFEKRYEESLLALLTYLFGIRAIVEALPYIMSNIGRSNILNNDPFMRQFWIILKENMIEIREFINSMKLNST